MALKAIVAAMCLLAPSVSGAQSAMETGAAILSERASGHARRGRLGSAERDLNIAIDARPRELIYRRQRGAVRFSRSDYDGAVSDLDAYLSAVPKDQPAQLLRSVAEESRASENVADACSELLPARHAFPHVGFEKYCAEQPGW